MPDFKQIRMFSPDYLKGPVSYFVRICPVGGAMIRAKRRLDGQTYNRKHVMKIIDIFCDCAKCLNRTAFGCLPMKLLPFKI